MKKLKKMINIMFDSEISIGFKRITLGISAITMCFLVLILADCLPKANAFVQQQDDFHKIEGCWYSTTPTSTGLKSSVDGYNKYCYTLVDRNKEIPTSSKSNYQYIVDETDNVYVFEYYTWISNSLQETQQIAVYSQTDLTSIEINGEKYFYEKNNPNYIYESVDEYLYYRLYQFVPDWQSNGTYYYSTNPDLTFNNDSYFGYKLISEDIYKNYKDVEVDTQYVIDFNNNDYYYYNNIYFDEEGNIVYNGSITDTSEKIIINKNDINQATYVIERLGDAYVTTDASGNQIGSSNFSTNTYYKGGLMYVYSDNIVINDTTVKGFKVYEILKGDTIEILKSELKNNTEYSLITFNEKGDLIAEAIRYYNLYEISYELVQNSTEKDFNNENIDWVNSQYEINKEVIVGSDPSSYDMTYEYTFNFTNGYTYKIKYYRQKFVVSQNTYTKTTTTDYALECIANNVTEENFNNNYSGSLDIENWEKAKNNTAIGYFNSNQQFYEHISSTLESIDYTYTPSITQKIDSGKITSKWWEKNNNTITTTTNASLKNYSTIKYENSNGITVAIPETKNLYYVNGKYYLNKTSALYSNVKTSVYKVEKNNFDNTISLPYDTNINNNYLINTKSTKISGSAISDISTGDSIIFGASYTSKIIRAGESAEAIEWSENIDEYQYCEIPLYNSYELPSYYLKSFLISGLLRNAVTAYEYDLGTDTGLGYTINITPRTIFRNKCVYDGYYYNYNWSIGDNAYKKSTIDYGDSYYLYRNYSNINSGYVGKITIEYNNGTSKAIDVSKGVDYNINIDDSIKNIYLDLTINYHVREDMDDCSNSYYETYSARFLLWSSLGYTRYSGSYYVLTKTGEETVNDIKYDANNEAGNYSYSTSDFDYKNSQNNQNLIAKEIVGSKYYKYTYSTEYEEKSNSNVTIDYINQSREYSNLKADKIEYNLKTNTETLSDEDINKIKNYIKENIQFNLGVTKNNITNISYNKDNKTFVITLKLTDKAYIKDKNGNLITTISNLNNTVTITLNCSYNKNMTKAYYNIYKIKKINSTTGNYVKIEDGTSEEYFNLNGINLNNYVSNNKKYSTTTSELNKKITTTEYFKKYDLNEIKNDKEFYVYSNSNIAFSNAMKDGNVINFTKETINGQALGKYNGYYYSFNSYANNNDSTGTISYTYKINNKVNNIPASTYLDKAFELCQNANSTITLTKNNYKSSVSYVDKYSGKIIEYKFTIVPTKKIVNYGKESNNFGVSNISSDSYYSNIEYDANGNIINGNWNGTYALPQSYNLFNEKKYFETYGKYNDLKINKDGNGYSVYTLNNSVTIDLANYIDKNVRKTYYLSYYINGSKQTQTYYIKGSDLNTQVTIGTKTGNGYTISRIMLTTIQNKEYTEYVDINVENYVEKFIAHKTQITNTWYGTTETATAYIENLKEILADYVWNNDETVIYKVVIGGKTFTYCDDEIKYGVGNELYLNDGTERIRWKNSNNLFGYILNRKIIVEKSLEGLDLINTTNLADYVFSGSDFYNENYYKTPYNAGNINSSNTVKNINGTGYVYKNTIIGQLMLYYYQNGNSLANIYVIKNSQTNEYKMVEATNSSNFKYELYYDNNKSTNDYGLTFTYLERGFKVENGELLQAVKDSNGKYVKDSNEEIVYETIYVNSLVENNLENEEDTQGNLDKIIASGLVPYTGNTKSDTTYIGDVVKFKETININDYNVIKDMYINWIITFEKDSNGNIIDYNEFTLENSNGISLNNDEYIKNYRNYIMLLNSSVADGTSDLEKDGYVNAYYTDINKNIYRLKNETISFKDNYQTVPDYKQYKQYELIGQWVKMELNSELIDYSSFKGIEKVDKNYNTDEYQAIYKVGEEHEIELPIIEYETDSETGEEIEIKNNKKVTYNLSVYLNKVKDNLGTSYDGLYIGDNIEMRVLTYEINGETKKKFVFVNGDKYKNVKDFDDLDSYDYLSSNLVAEELISNQTNIYQDVTGESIIADHLLVKREKVNAYTLAKKIPYELNYYVSENDMENLAVIDLRYQFNSGISNTGTSVEEILGNGQPYFIKGDSLETVLTISGGQYLAPDKKYYNTGTLFNGIVASCKEQSVAKPGIINISGTDYYETVAFGNTVYKLGNVAGQELIGEDFTKLINKMKTDLAKTIYEKIEIGSPRDLKNIVDALSKIQDSCLFKSTIFNVNLNLEALEKLVKNGYNGAIDEGNQKAEIEKMIQISALSEVANKLNRSADYLRIGNCCYYKYCDIDEYFSYRGVDTTLENNEYLNDETQNSNAIKKFLNAFSIGSFVTGGAGTAIITGIFAIIVNEDIKTYNGTTNKNNDLTFIAYSGILKEKTGSASSKISLKEVITQRFEQKNKQWFVQVQESDTDKAKLGLYNLPLAEVEYSYVKEGWETADIKSAKGIRLFALIPGGTGERFIISTRIDWQVISTASTFIESFLTSLTDENNIVKIGYGKQKSAVQGFSGNDMAALKYIGLSSTKGNDINNYLTRRAWQSDGFYESFNSIEKDYLAYCKNNQSFGKLIDDNVSGEVRNLKTVIRQKTTVSNKEINEYTIYRGLVNKVNMYLGADIGNWYTNFRQTVSEAASRLWDNFTNLFKNADEKETVPGGVNQYCITIYKLPIIAKSLSNADSFDVEALNKTDESFKIINKTPTFIDTDYSTSTNFDIKITNTSSSKVLFWGYELVATSYKSNTGFEGWHKKSNGDLCYVDSKRLSSKTIIDNNGYPRHINLILQDDKNDNVLEIKNLPANATYELRLYNREIFNLNNSSEIRNVGIDKISTDIIGPKGIENGVIFFETTSNLVYNPYGTTLKFNLESSYSNNTLKKENSYSGDALLKEEYIDYEVQKFLFDVNNINVLPTQQYIKTKINGQNYLFSTKYLMKKYLNGENVIQIAFYLNPLSGSISYGKNVEYMLYDSDLKKIVSEGNTSSKYGTENASDYTGIIYYTLTDTDKKILLNKYNNEVNEEFVNGYLLTDKLVFMIRNTSNNTWLDSDDDYYFEILWQPCYKDTFAYLDLNQDNAYNGSTVLKETYYNSSAIKIGSESLTKVEADYENMLYNVNQLEHWNTGITTSNYNGITLTLNNLIAYKTTFKNSDGKNYIWYQLCTYRDGESHIIK